MRENKDQNNSKYGHFSHSYTKFQDLNPEALLRTES